MPYVTNDNSKAARRITEIEQELQEAKADFDRWLAVGETPKDASELAQREREGKALADRLHALATALQLQRALADPALHAQERTLAKCRSGGSPAWRIISPSGRGAARHWMAWASRARWPASAW